MSLQSSELRSVISIGMAVLLLASPVEPIRAQQSPSGARKDVAKTDSVAEEKDPGWPRVYTNGKATLTVHQPQVDDWKDFKLLEARVAMEIVPEPGAKKLVAA